MIDLLAQVFGIGALIIMMLSYQQKTRTNLLRMQMLSNVLFVASYVLLEAYTMAVMCGINIARSFVFLKDDTKWGKSPAWLYVFLGVSLVGGILSWEGWISLLVIAATLVLTVALYCKNLAVTRKLFLVPPLLYISYNLLNKSVGGVGSDVFCWVSALIAIYRFDIRKKAKEQEDCAAHEGEPAN